VERKTYGTVLIMNLQESENKFGIESYDMEQYREQLKEREEKTNVTISVKKKKKSAEKQRPKRFLNDTGSKVENLGESIRVYEDPEGSPIMSVSMLHSSINATIGTSSTRSSSSMGSIRDDSGLFTLPLNASVWHPQEASTGLRGLILEGKHNLPEILHECSVICEEEQWNTKRLVSHSEFPILHNYLLHMLLMILGTEHDIKEDRYVCVKQLSNSINDLIIINTGLCHRHNPRENIFISLYVHRSYNAQSSKKNAPERIQFLKCLPWADMIKEYAPLLSFRKNPPEVFELSQHLDFSPPTQVQLEIPLLHSIGANQEGLMLFPTQWKNLSSRELALLDSGISKKVQRQTTVIPAVHVNKTGDEWQALFLVCVNEDADEQETPLVIGLRAEIVQESSSSGSSCSSRSCSPNPSFIDMETSSSTPQKLLSVVHKGVLATTVDHAQCIARIVERPVTSSWLYSYMKPDLLHLIQIDCKLHSEKQNLNLNRDLIPLLLKNIRADDLQCEKYCVAIRGPPAVSPPREESSSHIRLLLMFYVNGPSGIQQTSASKHIQKKQQTVLGGASLHVKARKMIVSNAAVSSGSLPVTVTSISESLRKDNELSKPGLLSHDIWFNPLNLVVSKQIPEFCDYYYNAHSQCCVVEVMTAESSKETNMWQSKRLKGGFFE